MENLLERDFKEIKKGSSQRFTIGTDSYYRFKWKGRGQNQSYDTSSFNKIIKYKSAGTTKYLPPSEILIVLDGVKAYMMDQKKGKFFKPDYKDYSITMIVYFITLEVISFFIWYFAWNKGWAYLFGIPIIMVILALVSIGEEIRKERKRSSSYVVLKKSDLMRNHSCVKNIKFEEDTLDYVELVIKEDDVLGRVDNIPHQTNQGNLDLGNRGDNQDLNLPAQNILIPENAK